MIQTFNLQTPREGFVNITARVQKAVEESGVQSGLCVVFCPHTTAGITINENADPDVVKDMLLGLDKAFPDRPEYRHAEGNSAAHLKASCVGSSVTVLIESGRQVLGTWQGIFFCEFDGPRKPEGFCEDSGGLTDNKDISGEISPVFGIDAGTHGKRQIIRMEG